jgi:hypothetical protein
MSRSQNLVAEAASLGGRPENLHLVGGVDHECGSYNRLLSRLFGVRQMQVAAADACTDRRRWQRRPGSAISVFVLLLGVCGQLTQGEDEARPPSPQLPRRAEAAATHATVGDMLLIRGADGTAEYGALFDEWVAAWEAVADESGVAVYGIGGDTDAPLQARGADRDLIQAFLGLAAFESERPLWIVMIGHGTFDGRDAKFNLTGDDLSAAELADWLRPVTRPVAVIQSASASGPFVEALSAPGRVVVAATKSGEEQNFARFGGYLAAAWSKSEADLDKDGQVSLLEAFLSAARATDDFYSADNRLATEHAVIDDNGDGQGTRATAFDGTRPRREDDSGTTLDGHRAGQWVVVPSAEERRLPAEVRQQRDALEVRLLELRDRRADFTEDEYYRQVETLVLEIARLYEGAHGPGTATN